MLSCAQILILAAEGMKS